jgi:hypothetical protein
MQSRAPYAGNAWTQLRQAVVQLIDTGECRPFR